MREWIAVLLLATLSGCATVNDPPALPDSPDAWAPESAELPPDPRITAATPSPAVDASRTYSLPALIDLAETTNPVTRAAWQKAKAAGGSVDLVGAAYRPRLSADVVGGYLQSSSAAVRDPLGILPAGTATTDVGVGAAVLSLKWLLYDFGVRGASRQEARELAFAANAAYSGAQQKLIHDVTTAYYDLWAALQRRDIQRRRARAAATIADAARARRARQLATVADVASAEQLVAQARFDLTRAQSEVTVARTRLATVVGLSPRQRIEPAYPKTLHLPSRVPPRIDAFLTAALQRRPDLQAAFARARASETHIATVKGEYGPKIVGSAAWGRSLASGEIDDSRYGSVGGRREAPIAGVFVGLSIPLWSGGAERERVRIAEARHQAALADARALRNQAEGQIVTAYETLKSSLAAADAAARLVETARARNDETRARFRRGLVTIADVSATERGLNDARLSEVEARHAALNAAATLAFASGRVR